MIAFPVNCQTSDIAVFNNHKNSGSELVSLVEARMLGKHQKECRALSHHGQSAWRLMSDEGPYLGGTDLGPFPLGFFAAGLGQELLTQAQGLNLDLAQLELLNRYRFEGSFLRGTGQGQAQSPQLAVVLNNSIDSASFDRQSAQLQEKFSATHASALLTQDVTALFAIRLNGVFIGCPLEGFEVDGLEANFEDESKAWSAASENHQSGIFKLESGVSNVALMPNSGAAQIEVQSSWLASQSTGSNETTGSYWNIGLRSPPGSSFGFACEQAASPVDLLLGGVAFCFLTQVSRYTEALKLPYSLLRLKQFLIRSRQGSYCIKTLLDIESEAQPKEIGDIASYSANTCYLHAALRSHLSLEIVKA